jgi:hypothetical protein
MLSQQLVIIPLWASSVQLGLLFSGEKPAGVRDEPFTTSHCRGLESIEFKFHASTRHNGEFLTYVCITSNIEQRKVEYDYSSSFCLPS